MGLSLISARCAEGLFAPAQLISAPRCHQHVLCFLPLLRTPLRTNATYLFVSSMSHPRAVTRVGCSCDAPTPLSLPARPSFVTQPAFKTPMFADPKEKQLHTRPPAVQASSPHAHPSALPHTGSPSTSLLRRHADNKRRHTALCCLLSCFHPRQSTDSLNRSKKVYSLKNLQSKTQNLARKAGH